MIQFLVGLSIGFVAAIFVYRNNQKTISKYAGKVDELWDKLSDEAKSGTNKQP